ncbi:MAG TPA: GH1 family beta-glucosidase [Acidimicrobiales bacterium]|nr:GH1 family beta-glucosidase [Acidimicrobiales bacterium]
MTDHSDSLDGFYWGASTAAYQIEGSPLADGAGRCVWHEFSHTPNTVDNGDNGDVACDHYHRRDDDIALMRDLGLGAYRFSIRWPRILPEGTGEVNPAGLDFYDRLVDQLLAANIEPFVTLYHWDLPATLQRRGGWSNPDVAEWFADYVAVVVKRLGDRVSHWITLNEPFVVAEQGHLVGAHAPGIRNIYATGHAIHNQLRAHIGAWHVIKSAHQRSQVGIALHNAAAYPASESAADVEAAERANAWHNYPLFLEPLVNGRYPAPLEDRLAPYLPRNHQDDMNGLRIEPDFVGMNYYSGYLARHDSARWLGFESVPEPSASRTAMDWIVRPDGLRKILVEAHRRYNLKALYVTESGAAYVDHVVDGEVDDTERLTYIQEHVAATLAARAEGAPVRGYFVWSLFDNFEWARGYAMRFGIVHIDFATQERLVKASGRWYAELARSGAISVV